MCDNIYIERNKQQKEIMNKITKQIIENNLPISDVCRTVAIDKVDKNGKVTTCEIDNPVYKWYNKDTKKWYFGDKWSQKCNFSPNSAINCGGKHYIAKIFKNHKRAT